MKVKVQNIGALDYAEFDLGDITIICGENNTGKTYATYATYGFLDFWRSAFNIDLPEATLSTLREKGVIKLDLKNLMSDYNVHLTKASEEYTKYLPYVFAGNDALFSESRFSASLDSQPIQKSSAFSLDYKTSEKAILHISKEQNSDELIVSLLIESASEVLPSQHLIKDAISRAVKEIVYSEAIPMPYIASAERTGSAIFQRELDFTRNRIVSLLGNKHGKINPMDLLGNFKADYPIPVRRNVDFIRELPNIVSASSSISEKHPDIIDALSEIIGGEFKVSKDGGEIQYLPEASKRVKLSLVESSSCVRSLLDIVFYVKHLAKPGDLLMIDEPELNLHPNNQRRVARLFARLANVGVRVFITTHSDYIIKELNTLILLGRDDARMRRIAEKERYDSSELLTPDKLRVYMSKKDLVDMNDGGKRKRRNTIVKANVSERYGIEAETFDATINEMNRIQDEIEWGDESND